MVDPGPSRDSTPDTLGDLGSAILEDDHDKISVDQGPRGAAANALTALSYSVRGFEKDTMREWEEVHTGNWSITRSTKDHFEGGHHESVTTLEATPETRATAYYNKALPISTQWRSQ
jgi:hypothetical protein